MHGDRPLVDIALALSFFQPGQFHEHSRKRRVRRPVSFVRGFGSRQPGSSPTDARRALPVLALNLKVATLPPGLLKKIVGGHGTDARVLHFQSNLREHLSGQPARHPINIVANESAAINDTVREPARSGDPSYFERARSMPTRSRHAFGNFGPCASPLRSRRTLHRLQSLEYAPANCPRICICSLDRQQQMTKREHAMQSRRPVASLCSMRLNETPAAVAGPQRNGDRNGHRYCTQAFRYRNSFRRRTATFIKSRRR